MKPVYLLLSAASLAAAATAAPYVQTLDARQCAVLPPREVSRLVPDVGGLARYVQRCRVRGPGGRVALTVDIVRLDRALGDNVFTDHAYGDTPRPILRNAAGRIVGRLPEGFPVDPPGELKVRFTRWQGGWPREILLWQAGESAIGPHALRPLRWDRGARSYR